VKVAAVVVRWRGGDEIDRCLRSLLEHGGARLERVVMVDSGSGDGGADRLAADFPEIEVVALEANHSFARAVNTGARRCDEEALLILNPDAQLTVGALEALTSELEQHPDAAGVVPHLTNPDGSSQHDWQLRDLPTTARLALGLSGRPAFQSPPTTAVPVAQPAAAAWLVRSTVWQALGGFDERYTPAWWEDVDLCARLADRLGTPGFPADRGFCLVPTATVLHQGGTSVRSLSDTAFLRAFFRNLIRYAEQHHSRRATLIRAGLTISLIGRALLRPRTRRAHIEAVRSLSRRTGS
jgi:GT2 family glycosyltransferase